MADQELDAKEGTVDEEGPGGKSSDPSTDKSIEELDMEHFDPNAENIIETVEDIGGIDTSTGGAGDKPVNDDKETSAKEDVNDDGTKSTAKADKDKGGEPEKDTRYDKDPAWQRILKERNDAIAKADELTRKVEAFEKPASAKDDGDTEIIDISTMSKEELIDWQDDDPKGYAENLRRYATQDAKAAVRAELAREKEATKQAEDERAQNETFMQYGRDNSANDSGTGFLQMWDAHKIQDYMDKHPGHNAISAHMALTESYRIDKAVKDAVSKVKKDVAKEKKARIVTDGLDSGPGYTPNTVDEKLQNTKKWGGKISVIADKLAKRRQG